MEQYILFMCQILVMTFAVGDFCPQNVCNAAVMQLYYVAFKKIKINNTQGS